MYDVSDKLPDVILIRDCVLAPLMLYPANINLILSDLGSAIPGAVILWLTSDVLDRVIKGLPVRP